MIRGGVRNALLTPFSGGDHDYPNATSRHSPRSISVFRLDAVDQIKHKRKEREGGKMTSYCGCLCSASLMEEDLAMRPTVQQG